jgi:hypothetical protein
MYRPVLAIATGIFVALAAVALAAQPAVTLLDAGAAPRQELRYRLEAGRTEYGALSTSMQMRGTNMPAVSGPPMTMRMMMRTTDVSADGVARYEFEVTAVETGNGGASPVLDPAIGGWARIDARGLFLEGDFALDALADGAEAEQLLGELNQSIQEMSAPFPVEAVGVGARWQVTSRIDAGGFRAEQTAEYTLLSRNGDRVELEVTVTQSADSQPVSMPGMPPEIQARLESLEAAGSGTMNVNLTRLVPTSTVDVGVSLSMAIDVQGQTQRMDMDMQSRTSISPVDD